MQKIVLYSRPRSIKVHFRVGTTLLDRLEQPCNAMLAMVPCDIIHDDGSRETDMIELYAEYPVPEVDTDDEADALDLEEMGYNDLKQAIISQAVIEGVDPATLRFPFG